jgi:hypothetical protein
LRRQRRAGPRHTPTVKKLMAVLRSRGGMLTILGVICVLVGPTLGTIVAGSSAALEVLAVAILLAGYIIIAVGLVMIVVAARKARGQEGSNKT